jgi:hypothetical protein
MEKRKLNIIVNESYEKREDARTKFYEIINNNDLTRDTKKQKLKKLVSAISVDELKKMKVQREFYRNIVLFESNPGDDNIGEWVSIATLQEYSVGFKTTNGQEWDRSDAKSPFKYNIEPGRDFGSNAKTKYRINGLKAGITHTIPKSVYDHFKKLNKVCPFLGTRHNMHVDHKKGRNRSPEEDGSADISKYQYISDKANLAKRQHCKECRDTNKRFDAKKMGGYSVSVVEGKLEYNEAIGCKGCYMFDPVEFREKYYSMKK